MTTETKLKRFAFPSEVADLIKGCTRVHVVTIGGAKEWHSPDKLPEGCQILLKDGEIPITMDREPGRPKKTDEEKETFVGALIAEKKKRRKQFLKSDLLLRKARHEPDSSDFMDIIMQELAKESASLGFEIEEHQNEGKEVSQISGRRVRVLKDLGDAWLRRQERLKSVGVVDLDTPAMMALFIAYTETLIEVMTSLKFEEEESQVLIAKFSTVIDEEWKSGARKKMKKAAEG